MIFEDGKYNLLWEENGVRDARVIVFVRKRWFFGLSSYWSSAGEFGEARFSRDVLTYSDEELKQWFSDALSCYKARMRIEDDYEKKVNASDAKNHLRGARRTTRTGPWP